MRFHATFHADFEVAERNDSWAFAQSFSAMVETQRELLRSVENWAERHTGIWKRIEPLGCSCSRGFQSWEMDDVTSQFSARFSKINNSE